MAKMKLETLRDLYHKELMDLHSAEKQIIGVLPKMQQAASSEDLKRAFQQHLQQTEQQLQRLEQVVQKAGQKAGGSKCKGMEGILEEGAEVLKMKGDPAALDAALIASAQKVEHYEIATYGTVATYAKMLGDMEAAKVLGQILSEEKRSDEKLTQLAESHINIEAAQGAD